VEKCASEVGTRRRMLEEEESVRVGASLGTMKRASQ
jgi:hypothetical protein